MKINTINEEVKNCPETEFDSFDLTIDLRKTGHALREQLVALVNLYGRINQLAANALFLYEQAKARYEEVESLAWGNVDPTLKATEKKKVLKTVSVDYGGIKTTLAEEEERVNAYSYISQRGKDKAKEISTVLDVGRTLLSWDKTEIERSYGS